MGLRPLALSCFHTTWHHLMDCNQKGEHQMDMLAYVKAGREPGLVLEHRPIPDQLLPGEALIEILATSICGTDVHLYKWDAWSQKRVKPPFIAGHEFSGRVIKVAPDVTRVKVGDIVSAETHIVCGTCEFCQRGEYHVCENTKIIGVDTDGCFAQYAKMPVSNLIVDHSGLDPKYLSIQEPLGNAVHTMLHFDLKDRSVAIVGAGPIGLMGVAIARAVGAKQVLAIEINEYRRNLAAKLGADLVINPLKEDVIQAVLQATNGRGIDVVCEFSGNKTAIEQAFKYVKAGGKMSMLGVSPQTIEIDISNDVVFKGIHLYGVVGREMFRTWEQVADLLKRKKLDLSAFITHFYRFDQMEEAMATMMSGNSGKVVLVVKEDAK